MRQTHQHLSLSLSIQAINPDYLHTLPLMAEPATNLVIHSHFPASPSPSASPATNPASSPDLKFQNDLQALTLWQAQVYGTHYGTPNSVMLLFVYQVKVCDDFCDWIMSIHCFHQRPILVFALVLMWLCNVWLHFEFKIFLSENLGESNVRFTPKPKP